MGDAEDTNKADAPDWMQELVNAEPKGPPPSVTSAEPTRPSPDDSSAPVGATASRFRRALAFWGDLTLGMAITSMVFGLIGLLVPPDGPNSMLTGLLPGLLLGIGYFGYATPILGNSFFKWLFGMRMVPHDTDRVSWLQWTGRLLLTPLWPLNGLVMLFSTSRRHLGDRVAQTRVDWVPSPLGRRVFKAPDAAKPDAAKPDAAKPDAAAKQPTSFVVVFVLWLVSLALIMQVGKLSLRLAVLNTPSYELAQQHLAQQGHDDLPVFPSSVGLVDDQASYLISSGDESIWVQLERPDGSWTVKSAEAVEPWSIDDPFRIAPVRGTYLIAFGSWRVGTAGNGISIGMR